MLENEKIKLRAVEPEDLELLYRWENDPTLWLAGNTRNPYSRFALKQYISDSQQDIYDSKQLRLMIDDKIARTTVGTVDLFDFDLHNSRISLGLFVANEFKGKGFATQALHLTEKYVFNFLKINQLDAFIAANNIPSIKMFEKEKYFASSPLLSWLKQSDGFVDVIVFQQFKNKVDC